MPTWFATGLRRGHDRPVGICRQNDSNATGTPTATTTQNTNAGASVSLPQQGQDEKVGIELKDLNVSAVVRADTTDTRR